MKWLFGRAESATSRAVSQPEEYNPTWYDMTAKYGGYIEVYDAFMRGTMTAQDKPIFEERFLSHNGMSIYMMSRLVDAIDRWEDRVR